MVIWTANWILLPARRSSSICEAAVAVIKLTKRMSHLFERLATLLLTSRRRQRYVSEFDPLYVKRLPNSPCEMVCRGLRFCCIKSSRNRGLFFRRYHGIGWALPQPSFLLRLSLST